MVASLLGMAKGDGLRNLLMTPRPLLMNWAHLRTIIYNGRVQKVCGIINERRTGPDADSVRIMYHEMVDKPDKGTGAFELRCTQKLFYNLLAVECKQENQGSAIAQQSVAASLLSHEQWATRFTSLHWLTKWLGTKGLQPIRPQITWTYADTRVPAGKALQLSR